MADDGWVSALPLADLADGVPSVVEVDAVRVLLLRSGDRIFAVANRCTHQGSPLDRGPVKGHGDDLTITCPAHGSTFRLVDGRVMRPPAGAPLPVFDTRVSEGVVELRPRQ